MEHHESEQSVLDRLEKMEEAHEEMEKMVAENNTILRGIRRRLKWELWVRIVWYVLLLGLPFALYFYILQPYFEALGSSYETFSAGIQEIPGWKNLNELITNTSDKVSDKE